MTLETDGPQHHVAVEVPLPAGLEAVDLRLGAGARARVSGELVSSPYLSHHELRPDRVVLFFDHLPPGQTRHSVPITATTVGRFTLPAAVAEAMYEPETRARTTAGGGAGRGVADSDSGSSTSGTSGPDSASGDSDSSDPKFDVGSPDGGTQTMVEECIAWYLPFPQYGTQRRLSEMKWEIGGRLG